MRQFDKHVMDDEAHAHLLLWWYRLVPHRSYVNGWKIGPSHYLNQDLGTIWLSAPQCGDCTARRQPARIAGGLDGSRRRDQRQTSETLQCARLLEHR